MFPLAARIGGLTAATRRTSRRSQGAARTLQTLAQARAIAPRWRLNLNTVWRSENGSSDGFRVRGIPCIRFPASIAISSGVQ